MKADSFSSDLENQKLLLLGRVTGNMVHDLNNLLTIIQLNAALLEEDPSMGGHLLQSVQEISQACSQSCAMTQAVLNFLRRKPDNTTCFNLGEVVETTHGLLAKLVGRRIQITFLPPERPVFIKGHPGIIEQALINLIINARDAIADKGEIIVSLKEAFPSKGFVLLRIQDNGQGISEEHLPHIFTEHFTTKAQGNGNGMGLAITAQNIQHLGGHIEVKSQLNVGTTFFIYLPIYDNPEVTELGQEAPSRTLPAAQLAGKCLLLVEDDPGILNLGKKVLESFGCTVLAAADAEQALAIWQESKSSIDGLFTDIVLPGNQNGYDLIQKFKSEKPELKVLATSGYHQENRGSTQCPNVDFLPKPYAVHRLREVLEKLFQPENRTSPNPPEAC